MHYYLRHMTNVCKLTYMHILPKYLNIFYYNTNTLERKIYTFYQNFSNYPSQNPECFFL